MQYVIDAYHAAGHWNDDQSGFGLR
jgi:hypothetical protein